jgi:signal transduction histidine kinase
MRTRNLSIRAKIISLLLIPLVTLVGMWALATYVTVIPGVDLLRGQVKLDNIGHPGGAMLTEIQAERRASVVYLATGRRDAVALIAQRAKTDAAISAFRQVAGSQDTRDASTDVTVSRLDSLFTNLDSLGRYRGGVDRGDVDRSGAMTNYAVITDSIYQVFATLGTTADEGLARESNTVVKLGRAREILAREDAVLSGALAAGSFTSSDLSQTILLIGAQRFGYADAVPELYVTVHDDYTRMVATDPFTRVATIENRIIAEGRAGAKVPADAASWDAAYAQVAQDLRDFEFRAADSLVDRSGPVVISVFGRIVVAGLLGLIAVIITMIASIRIGRSLIKRLAGLRQAALELAVDRLPTVMARLRQSEDVDLDQEAPPLPYGDDEVGQVGHAFNELQRTAINSAIEEAKVRRGLNEVFLNIARRSQTLLHRQLSILDRMERRTDDPAELEDLFRVDHLATRMRRHAEDLVILAGAAPGRGWRNPVPIVDVLRGAVSEVEDYARVSIRPMPEVALTGRAVGDVIHLLAELIENATSFSPPHTRVNVGGEAVSHGFAVEIEDRGLGMTPDALADSNHRLSNPPEFDPANSAQLGLFVVARLAERHGVRVQLRSSAYGGITAVVLIPDELVVTHTGEITRPMVPRQREAVAALPQAPHTANGTNGTNRGTLYRELSNPPRPPIVAPPAQVASAGFATTQEAEAPAPAPVTSEPVMVTPATVTEGKPIPRHARQEIIEAPVSSGSDGLPRRVRQTNIAPQLRDDPATPGGGDATQGAGTRSPEELRAMMTSFQAGTVRGRIDAEVDDSTDHLPEGDAR